MAKVPDLNSDFSQKLLRDLRRRRETLGFESSGQHTSNTAPRGAHANSQKPLQGASRGGRAEATTNRLYQQSSNAIVKVGKQHCRNNTPEGLSHDIVPFGGGHSQRSANTIDVQMALALALSNSGKLQNIEVLSNAKVGGELVTRRGSIFFGEPNNRRQYRDQYLFSSHNARVGNVAVGVQKLNDILAAYSAGVGDCSRSGSIKIGKQLFKGAMDLEESLSMLIMLQEASDYMVGSGNGKVLLLEDKEESDASSSNKANRKKPMHHRSRSSFTGSSAKLVEIVDEDSRTEHTNDARDTRRSSAKSSANASLQLITHKRSEPDLQLTIVTNTGRSTASGIDNIKKPVAKGGKDDAKVRMPNVIAKLMGLQEFPRAKADSEHKGTEKIAKHEAKTSMAMSIDGTGSKLPIQTMPSERELVKRESKKLPAREEKTVIANSEESESVAAMSNCSRPTIDKQANGGCANYIMNQRVTKKEVFRQGESMERRQGLDEHKKPIEDSKIQKVTKESVTYRNVGAKKMDFLKKDRTAENGLLIEEKHMSQEKYNILEKKQIIHDREIKHAAHSKKDSEVKSRTREKFAKENHAITEMNGQRDHMKRTRQLPSKHRAKQNTTKKVPDHREMRRHTASRNVLDKKSLKADPVSIREKAVPPEPAVNKSVDRAGSQEEDGIHDTKQQLSSPEEASPDHAVKQNMQATDDPTSFMAQNSKAADQSTTVETNSDNIIHVATEPELQLLNVREQPIEGLNKIDESSKPIELQGQNTSVVMHGSLTENQRFLLEMLLKDQHLLDIARAIIGIPIRQDVNKVKEWPGKDNKILSDIGQEVMTRKGKRDEAIVNICKMSSAQLKVKSLDALIKELDGDIESLNISKKAQCDDDDTAECLQTILHRDIQNRHPDTNSMWDFGWNYISHLPIETYEVVRDMEKQILNGIITDLARDLIQVSVRHVCCEA